MDDATRRQIERVREAMAELEARVRELEAYRAMGRPTGATELQALVRALRRAAERLNEEAQNLPTNHFSLRHLAFQRSWRSIVG